MRIMIHHARVLAAALALTAAAARPGLAQPRAECRAMIAAVQRDMRRVEAWSRIPRCGAEGAAAVADAFERNRRSTDVSFWTRFGDVAIDLHHPALLRSALRVAADSAASFPARALGLQLALTLHDPNANFARGHHPLGLDAILAGGVGENTPRGEPCIVPALASLLPAYTAPLPADAPARITATVDAIAADRRAPATLRHMARCIAREVRGQTPVPGHGAHHH